LHFRTRYKMELSDFEFLQEIQARIGKKLKVKDIEPKLADLLKVIELKYKIKDESQKEKVFWDLVDELVDEELSRKELDTMSVAEQKGNDNADSSSSG